MIEPSLPPMIPVPAPVAGLVFALTGARRTARLRGRYGRAYQVKIPGVGVCVAVSDPALVKQVFTAKPDVVRAGGDFNPLSRTLGPKSMFAIDGDEHLRQRRLLLPPFHGERMGAYTSIFEEETLREIATWPEGEEFPTIPGTMRITLNAILRAVFGAHDEEFDEFLEFMPPWVKLGSLLTSAPGLQRDLGRRSPWGRFLAYRRRFDGLVDRLIAQGRNDPNLTERSDVLALMLQARYDDGGEMTRDEIADQLLAMLVAGHETTAGTLAWAVERLRRHPVLLQRLADEIEEGGSALREATIYEVQRTRPVIAGATRLVEQPFALGEWVLPPGMVVLIDSVGLHTDPELFPDPYRFDPDRFVGTKPDTYQWVPFGGGRRRCIGAAFAQLEMDVVLRVMIEQLELIPTSERDEKWRFRGVAFAPSRGGAARVRRRAVPLQARREAEAALA
ncbi:MAG: cytochrome P450 [Solirubrobacteraceae bacterium]|nr:cytochrome P450 [Solirubrobacteraceae bacterium]